jgi:3-oxoacyl-[acyl-carrier protein] reductase
LEKRPRKFNSWVSNRAAEEYQADLLFFDDLRQRETVQEGARTRHPRRCRCRVDAQERRRPVSGPKLVIGANGFLGSHVTRQLVAAGHDVRAMVREGANTIGIDDLNTQRFVGDIWDNDTVAEAMTGCEDVYYCVVDTRGYLSDPAPLYRTNVDGTVWAIRAAVPAMLEAGGGDIVIIASVAGLRGGGNEAVYAASKFAQVGLAGAIDRELRQSGIRVTALCPAAVSTEFAIGRGRTEGDAWLDDVLQPEDLAAAVTTVLRQPRRMRTTQWSMWAMTEGS